MNHQHTPLPEADAIAESASNSLRAALLWSPTKSAALALSHASQADAAEWLICHLLEEELDFSFRREPLSDLKSFIVCEDGYRRIVVADDIETVERIFLYFHYIGHLALGHLGHPTLTIRTEPRNHRKLPDNVLLQEYLADKWATRLLEKRSALVSSDDNPFVDGALQSARNIGVRGKTLRLLLHRLSDLLIDNFELYANLRKHPKIHKIVVGLYSHFETS